MKRITSALTALLLLFALVACGAKTEPNATPKPPETVEALFELACSNGIAAANKSASADIEVSYSVSNKAALETSIIRKIDMFDGKNMKITASATALGVTRTTETYIIEESGRISGYVANGDDWIRTEMKESELETYTSAQLLTFMKNAGEQLAIQDQGLENGLRKLNVSVTGDTLAKVAALIMKPVTSAMGNTATAPAVDSYGEGALLSAEVLIDETNYQITFVSFDIASLLNDLLNGAIKLFGGDADSASFKTASLSMTYDSFGSVPKITLPEGAAKIAPKPEPTPAASEAPSK